MSYSINLAKLADGKVVTRLLNKVTLDLLEKGDRQWAYPWQVDTIEKEIGRGNVYLLTKEQRLVGTFFLQTITALAPLNLPKKSLYLSKMAVLPKEQGQDLGHLILEYCRGISETHALPVYLECLLSNQELRVFFENTGCELVGSFAGVAVYQLIN